MAPTRVAKAIKDPGTGTVDSEAETTKDGAEKAIVFHAIAASTSGVADDLLK